MDQVLPMCWEAMGNQECTDYNINLNVTVFWGHAGMGLWQSYILIPSS